MSTRGEVDLSDLINGMAMPISISSAACRCPPERVVGDALTFALSFSHRGEHCAGFPYPPGLPMP